MSQGGNNSLASGLYLEILRISICFAAKETCWATINTLEIRETIPSVDGLHGDGEL
jgi:hypothetical protein